MFKYFNFFADSLVKFLSLFTIQLHPVTLRLLLPVGISFYTFQTLSYVIDVYRGNVKAEKNFCAYAAFVSFFPQLVAGPIERTNNLLPQIKAPKVFKYEQAMYGLKLTAWGLFKKVAIADVLAVWVDKVYGNVYAYKGFVLLIATLFFTIQIYCDFSGYSDIARGCAKMMGIDLMENFRSPYFSASVREYWSRWHISLSKWLKDYVYIPLGGSRVKPFRHYMNIMITFMISGLWHGANWTYILWGAMHGAAQIVEKFFTKDKNYKPHGMEWGIRVIATFIYCMFSRVFYRANNIYESIYIFTHSFDGITNLKSYILDGIAGLKEIQGGTKNILGLMIILAIYDYLSLKEDAILRLGRKNLVLRWGVYMVFAFFMSSIILLPSVKSAEFIYFQF